MRKVFVVAARAWKTLVQGKGASLRQMLQWVLRA